MISLIQNLPVGNAVRVFITPAIGVTKWRVLRKSADTFTGFDDPSAYVLDESDNVAIVDATGLMNGSTYFYRDYGWNGVEWVDGGSTVSAIPAAAYNDDSVDVISILRERIHAGLVVEISKGALVHETGKIPVLLAPPTFEDTKWPVVTIHLASDSAEQRFNGEMCDSETFDIGGIGWDTSEGWLSSVQVTIVGWALNPDVRMALRKAIKRILMANLSIFDDRGMYQVAMNQQDTEDFQSYAAPVYQVMTTFSCLAKSAISSPSLRISEVFVTPSI